jgi:hypothetical protein
MLQDAVPIKRLIVAAKFQVWHVLKGYVAALTAAMVKPTGTTSTPQAPQATTGTSYMAYSNVLQPLKVIQAEEEEVQKGEAQAA